jgi:hypothetical protein
VYVFQHEEQHLFADHHDSDSNIAAWLCTTCFWCTITIHYFLFEDVSLSFFLSACNLIPTYICRYTTHFFLSVASAKSTMINLVQHLSERVSLLKSLTKFHKFWPISINFDQFPSILADFYLYFNRFLLILSNVYKFWPILAKFYHT